MKTGDVRLGADKTPCECSHAREDHREVGIDGVGTHALVIRGECEVNGCDCSRYTPETYVPP
jgi:hypothetical protein